MSFFPGDSAVILRVLLLGGIRCTDASQGFLSLLGRGPFRVDCRTGGGNPAHLVRVEGLMTASRGLVAPLCEAATFLPADSFSLAQEQEPQPETKGARAVVENRSAEPESTGIGVRRDADPQAECSIIEPTKTSALQVQRSPN